MDLCFRKLNCAKVLEYHHFNKIHVKGANVGNVHECNEHIDFLNGASSGDPCLVTRRFLRCLSSWPDSMAVQQTS